METYKKNSYRISSTCPGESSYVVLKSYFFFHENDLESLGLC